MPKQFEFALEDFNRLLLLPPGETTSIFYAQLPFGGGTNQVFTTSTLKNFIFDYIGLTEFGLKRYNNALVYFDSAIHLDSKVADFYAHRGMVHEVLHNYEGAKNDYIIALSYDRDHSIAQHNLDRLPVKKEKIDLEEVTLTQSIEHDPHLPYPYRERAFYRFKKGNYKGALEDYNKAISIDTMEIETWLNRGLVKEKLSDLRGAYSDYTKVIDLQENNSKAWMSRGNILSKMRRDKEAIEDYTIAIFYYPDYPQAYYNRAIVRQRTGNLQEACADFKLATLHGMAVSERLMKAACEGN
jgi:tetratricopeptide (TPR) repeat protein